MRAVAMSKWRDSNRHPHAVAELVTLAVLGCLISVPAAYGRITDKPTEGRWILNDAPAPIPSGLNIATKDDQVQGEGPCNFFSAPWANMTASGTWSSP